MIGTIIVLLIIIAVLYYLYSNDRLNADSINQSSPSINQSSDSITKDEDKYTVKFNAPKVKSLRVSYGENSIGKITISDTPLSYPEIIDLGNKMVGGNTVFVGVINETISLGSTGNSANNRVTSNFTIKQFKNLFIVFKGVEHSEIKVTANMARYESEGMVFCLIDSSSNAAPDLRDVSYPITVVTNNANVQLKLKEWGYNQVNDAGTVFIKNEKSFRLQ
ncbi:odv-e25 [Leucania separata nucleopolyhedrovirus]|uniref:Odv-e25 n=1 Tax=Leucania separata nucleopolyhedrovirus TaxID=1307956 RepID=Q0IL19_NPVLS|nr:odv-e25 [Leucania separata nucleopolyhedrovirus]AAR28864.1 odv-e25 [Leucania separata nucleopolyhedrovirus]